jgi:hypothetical protein
MAARHVAMAKKQSAIGAASCSGKNGARRIKYLVCGANKLKSCNISQLWRQRTGGGNRSAWCAAK